MWIGSVTVTAGRDVEDDAVRHERRIERERDIVRGFAGDEGDRVRVVGREHVRKPAQGDACRHRGGQVGNERAVDERQTAAGQRFGVEPRTSRRDRGGVGHGGERQRLAHRVAQIGVMPILDPAMRQTGFGKGRERGGTQARGGGAAWSRRRLERRAEGEFGRRARADDRCAHRRLTPRPPARHRPCSPRVRAPWPAPCRRCA